MIKLALNYALLSCMDQQFTGGLLINKSPMYNTIALSYI